MGLFDSLANSFKNKEQLEKDRIEYERDMFPLGVEPTKVKILEALRPFFKPKTSDMEILFPFLTAKQEYKRQDASLEQIVKSTKKNAFKIEDEQIKAILALVLLEQNVAALDDYPTADAVEKKAAELSL